MSIPIFLILFIIFVIFLQIKLKRAKTSADVVRKYLEEERELNMSPKKDIGEEFFVKPDLDRLPIGRKYPWDNSGRLATKESYVLKKSKLPMIKFKTPLGNRDLKSEFGIANFMTIIDYEENYNIFIRALIDWSQMLMENGAYNEAEQVLRESIRLGSDYVKNFTLLADIYAQNYPEKLNGLYKEIQNSQTLEDDSHVKGKALEYINGLLAAETSSKK